jgi:hypothetical protein
MADLDDLLQPDPEPPDPRNPCAVVGVICVGVKKTAEELRDVYTPNWRTGDLRSPWAIDPALSVVEFVEDGVSTFLGYKP